MNQEPSSRHDTTAVPIYLIIAVTAIVAFGTISGVLLRPTESTVSLTRNGANWPPAPTARPENAPPE